MAPAVGELMRMIYRRFKPHILMVLVHLAYTFLYLLTEASFNHGMDAHVFVTYRHALGCLVIFPFAYFLERYRILMCVCVFVHIYISNTHADTLDFHFLSCRKVRPKLTLALFLEIFVLSLIG